MAKLKNGAIAAAVIALALPVITHFEGLRQKTYIDPVGIYTACYGHTGKEVSAGKSWTIGECLTFLHGDINRAYTDVDRCLTGSLTVYEAAAFSSFAFNVGGKKFCGSTLVKKANAGDMPGSCAELSKWVYAGGEVLPGLVKRRAAERKLCETKEAV